MRNFAARLKQVREAMKLDVEPFAQACGVKKTAQYNYESGERSPNAEYLEKLATLGVDIHRLLTGEPFREKSVASDVMPGTYSLSGKLVDEISALKLSKEDADMLLQLARRLAKP